MGRGSGNAVQAEGILFDIQRFSLSDGPGIRTNVFFKGCPLHCLWCHNPEGIAFAPQVGYTPRKCIGCGACIFACPQGLHSIDARDHRFDRQGCMECFVCCRACSTGALEQIGSRYTADEVLTIVRKDLPFYRQSGGGMTLSGGEPLAQPAFALALARGAVEEGIDVCIETSGGCARQALTDIAPWCSLFLFDIKVTNDADQATFVGGDRAAILGNLHHLDALGKPTVLRCPVIPGVNDGATHFEAVATIANGLGHLTGIDLEPYHPLGLSKAERIDKKPAFSKESALPQERAEHFAQLLRGLVNVPVQVQ